jgi:sugar phosphate isomerase/epimerase
MCPVRRGRLEVSSFVPSPDPTDVGYPHYTLDLSHTAAAGVDALRMARRMGSQLTHVHLADGSGAPRDEHLVPGRGSQPCAEVCLGLVERGFTGTVVLEVSTRRARTRPERRALLIEALLFARLNL